MRKTQKTLRKRSKNDCAKMRFFVVFCILNEIYRENEWHETCVKNL